MSQCSRLGATKFVSVFSDSARLFVTAVLYNILSSVLPILLFLVSGYALGKVLPKFIVHSAVKRITPVVWIILFVIGLESGEAFSSLAAGLSILKHAAVYAFTISA